MWRDDIDCQIDYSPGLFGARVTKTGAFSWFGNTLKQMNIRLDIQNIVASSGARIFHMGQLLDYGLCAFMACRGTNLSHTFSFLSAPI